MKNRKGDHVSSHNEFDWEGYRKMSDDAYENARITGDMRRLASHNLLRGEIEIDFAKRLARLYFEATPNKGLALDVACGCGHMTYCLAHAGFDATGFDISDKAIALARKTYPDIPFFCGDGTKPVEYFHNKPPFDFIYIREFHPFTRVDDFGFQIKIIDQYLDIINSGGFIIIVHSRRRDCANLDMERVKRHFANTNVKTAGPLYFFPHKHLRIQPHCKAVNKAISFLTKIYATVRQRYPVEIFLIHKTADCCEN